MLDTCLYTTPGKFGGGGAGTTWLVGSAADVATALDNYRKLGITRFVHPCVQVVKDRGLQSSRLATGEMPSP
ncbi:hypothetical protein ABZZ79_32035 [Streptomyces sp. NPDC006458]|uniref:hypothetical protein n=1 Tax=Streptomyces sp. NPDC006458 TaxID=3154302 RepID=UPI00339E6A2F